MKVLFQTRQNAFTRQGGDTIQLLKTKEFVEKLHACIDVSVGSQKTSFRSYDIVHVFNITGDCQTALFQISNAKKEGKKVALSPIYWNGSTLQEVENRFLISALGMKNGLDILSLKYLAISLLRSFHLQRALDGITFLRDKVEKNADAEFKAKIAFGQKTIQAMCLRFADIILPNSLSEANLIIRDFGVPVNKIFVVPNGVDKSFFDPDPNLFRDKFGLDNFVLSVANLGTRKNTIALIQAVQAERIPLVLIGSSNPNDIYCKLCSKAAQQGGVTILGKIPHDSPLLASAYAAAKVHAQVSWFETPGLSSLEAALAGCNIVVSDRGSTRDYFKHYAWYCNPAEVRSIRKAISEAYNSSKKLDLKLDIVNEYTWDKVAKKTMNAYQKVINGLPLIQT